MNAKLCKRLRKTANKMMLDLNTQDPKQFPITERRLMIHPRHEARAKKGDYRHITAVNHPQSVRGIYRWLKRNYAKAIA